MSPPRSCKRRKPVPRARRTPKKLRAKTGSSSKAPRAHARDGNVVSLSQSARDKHLRTPAEMAAYFEACLEEADGDASFIAKALGDSRARKAWRRSLVTLGSRGRACARRCRGERSPDFETILRVVGARRGTSRESGWRECRRSRRRAAGDGGTGSDGSTAPHTRGCQRRVRRRQRVAGRGALAPVPQHRRLLPKPD
jgi:DNA-binding phage protein